MQFTKRLRDGVRRGEITCSVRIWTHPHVKPGGRYRMGEGQVEVDSIESIELADVTPALARESGFDGVVDLLETAKHGRGTNAYLVRFHYLAPGRARGAGRKAVPRAKPLPGPRRKKPSADRQRKRVVCIVERLPGASALASGAHLSRRLGRGGARDPRGVHARRSEAGAGPCANAATSAARVASAVLSFRPRARR